MKDAIKSWVAGQRWFLAFTSVFAALMAFVFWGTWSPGVAPVMPDDCVWHPLAWVAQFRAWWNVYVSNGKFVPSDIFWQSICISPYWTQELKYALSAYCSALGLAYFLRGRGLSHLASYGAGMLLGFCGYWFSLFSAGHGGWFVWMTYGTFAFGLADRAVRGGQWRHWILLGACIAWASTYQADLWLLFTVLTGVYFIFVCVCERMLSLKGMLVAALAFVVIGAPNVYDAFTNALSGRDAQIEESKGTSLAGGKGDVKDGASAEEKAKADAEARWIFVTNWSLPPSETAEFFWPRINGDTSCPMTLQLARAAGKDTKPYTGALGRPINAKQGNYRQHSLYVGWVTCLLALIGVVFALLRTARAPTSSGNGEATFLDLSAREGTRSTGRDILFFAVAAVVCWLFSLGRYCEPVYRLVYALPFGDYLRAPVKWHHLTEFCLCVLAAYGIESLIGVRGLRGVRGMAVLSAVVLFGAIDLARVDTLYCAPIDLKVVRGGNAAAEFVLKAGKGKVADLVENGNGLLSWSFNAHGVGVTGDPNDKDVRFVWAGMQQIAQNKNLEGFLKARATPVGYYMVTAKGIFSVAPMNANVALYQMKGVPAPEPKSPWGKIKPGIFAMGMLSALGTIAALFIAVRGARTVRI